MLGRVKLLPGQLGSTTGDIRRVEEWYRAEIPYIESSPTGLIDGKDYTIIVTPTAK